ncbi:MAG: hypothetical protein ACRC5M_06970, partial [Anaeroplasmataceae bacterium]
MRTTNRIELMYYAKRIDCLKIKEIGSIDGYNSGIFHELWRKGFFAKIITWKTGDYTMLLEGDVKKLPMGDCISEAFFK